jgi:hypothetical protein
MCFVIRVIVRQRPFNDIMSPNQIGIYANIHGDLYSFALLRRIHCTWVVSVACLKSEGFRGGDLMDKSCILYVALDY